MKGSVFILAAGLGTRLQPLTANMPKALVPYGDCSLLEWNVRKALFFGYQDIVVNIHHFSTLMLEAIEAINHKYQLKIKVSDETNQLLDTGGGLLAAKDLFKGSDYVIIQNVDILSLIDFHQLVEYHITQKNEATLCINQRASARSLTFDDTLQLTGWRNTNTGQEIIVKNLPSKLYSFTGVHVFNTALLEKIQEKGEFSIIDTYLNLSQSQRIGGYLYNELWHDVGSVAKLENALLEMKQLSVYE